MVECPSTVDYINKGVMEAISEVLSEIWVYFYMKNLISTARIFHSHIHESTHFNLSALLNVHPC